MHGDPAYQLTCDRFPAVPLSDAQLLHHISPTLKHHDGQDVSLDAVHIRERQPYL
jgi:hypothetical protein